MNQHIPRILCVDDEPLNISLLEALLIPRGYKLVSAVNGFDALEKIKTERIDICLLDVMMPEMDGFELCRRIKADEALRSIPVVMITSLTDKESRILGIEAGAEDFISKPFDSAEVLARIKMLLYVKLLNDRVNAIIEASPVPLAMNDEQGNILFLNRAFIQTVGYSLKDIPTLAEWWPRAYPDPQYRLWVAENWQKNLEEAKRTSGSFIPMELVIVCKGGSVRTFICSVADLEGNFVGAHLVILYDITERKQAEDKMRHQHDLLVLQKEELETTLARVKQLEGIIPICSYCKKIRDDQKSWHQLETYITEHSEALFSHGMCPECYAEQMKIIEKMK